jgi:crotonobetainyl-CoA:carnitine CoA-transferase CaiB-like acyl-CoA transferase
MGGLLEGTRVLDFGRYIAGPFCATLLGDLGAEVIRVERVGGSEDRYIAPVTSEGDGAMIIQLGRNKLGMTLNPMKPEGREIVRKLVATADVVVANLPPETLEAMGLDYESLRAVKPDIILTTVSAFGHGGPYSDRVGFDAVGQAMSGTMHLTGHPDEPMRAFVPYVDFGTASLSAFGTMAALLERERTGKGQKVEASLLSTALTISNYWLIEQKAIARDRVGTANRGPTAGPADAFQTKDGWIVVHVVGQPLFERWAKLMGEDHWLDDPRFQSDIGRGDNGEVLSERMAAWVRERTTEAALAELDGARIPAGPVLSPQQALEDPHVIARDFLKPIAYPGLEQPAPVADTPVDLSETPGKIRARAPTLGEHTDQILAELGYDQAAIAALREKRVV